MKYEKVQTRIVWMATEIKGRPYFVIFKNRRLASILSLPRIEEQKNS